MIQPDGSPTTFESAIAELERIVEEMEGAGLSLEDGLARYQRGVILLKFCRGTLSEAEQRLLRLEGDALIETGDDDHP